MGHWISAEQWATVQAQMWSCAVPRELLLEIWEMLSTGYADRAGKMLIHPWLPRLGHGNWACHEIPAVWLGCSREALGLPWLYTMREQDIVLRRLKTDSLGKSNSLAHVSSPPSFPLSNLSQVKYLYSKKCSCCFRLVVSEAISLPHCLLGFLTPQSELACAEATFSCSSPAGHQAIALQAKSTSMQDAASQLRKSLAESKEMLRCLKALFFSLED